MYFNLYFCDIYITVKYKLIHFNLYLAQCLYLRFALQMKVRKQDDQKTNPTRIRHKVTEPYFRLLPVSPFGKSFNQTKYEKSRGNN